MSFDTVVLCNEQVFFQNENRKATQVDMADLEYYLPEILDQLQLLAKSGHK